MLVFGIDLSAVPPAAWAVGITCSLGFIACRALALAAACRAMGMCESPVSTARLFVEGAAVEACTWPGKVWADARRVAGLPGPLTKRLAAIAIWRGTSALAFATLVAAAALVISLQQGGSISLTLPALALWLWLIWAPRSRKRQLVLLALRSGDFSSAVWKCAALNLLASLLDLAAMSIMASVICNAPISTFAPWCVLVSAAAALSTLPLGIGVLDIGLLAAVGAAGSDNAAALVLAYRLTGPGLTLAVGGLSWLLRGAAFARHWSHPPVARFSVPPAKQPPTGRVLPSSTCGHWSMGTRAPVAHTSQKTPSRVHTG